MPDAYRHQSGYRVEIANRRADRENIRNGVSGRKRVRVGTDLTRIVTCGRLAALVISGGALMSLMHRAGTLMLVDGARRRRASGRAGDTQAEAVYQKRDYRDDLDVNTRPHFLSGSDSSDSGLRSQGRRVRLASFRPRRKPRAPGQQRFGRRSATQPALVRGL
jgi:hypothetical protein